jgi:hypothetical protein
VNLIEKIWSAKKNIFKKIFKIYKKNNKGSCSAPDLLVAG